MEAMRCGRISLDAIFLHAFMHRHAAWGILPVRLHASGAPCNGLMLCPHAASPNRCSRDRHPPRMVPTILWKPVWAVLPTSGAEMTAAVMAAQWQSPLKVVPMMLLDPSRRASEMKRTSEMPTRMPSVTCGMHVHGADRMRIRHCQHRHCSRAHCHVEDSLGVCHRPPTRAATIGLTSSP